MLKDEEDLKGGQRVWKGLEGGPGRTAVKRSLGHSPLLLSYSQWNWTSKYQGGTRPSNKAKCPLIVLLTASLPSSDAVTNVTFLRLLLQIATRQGWQDGSLGKGTRHQARPLEFSL